MFKRFPVKAIIIKKRGDTMFITFDAAMRDVRKDGTQSYVLKSEKKSMPPPPYEFFYTGKGGKPIIFLYSPEDGQYTPMKYEQGMLTMLKMNAPPKLTCLKCNNTLYMDPSIFIPMKIENPPTLKVEDKEMSFWHTLETRRTYDMYKPKDSFWSKYAPLIGIGIIFAALLFTILFFGETMSAVAGSAAAAAESAAKAAMAAAKIPPLG